MDVVLILSAMTSTGAEGTPKRLITNENSIAPHEFYITITSVLPNECKPFIQYYYFISNKCIIVVLKA